VTTLDSISSSLSSYPTVTPSAATQDAAPAPSLSQPARESPPPAQNSDATSQPAIYTALANVNASTIRGANLDIQA
jgi:myo-inositol-hexaphosphate 3-phosphohydrolase